jgi:predicted nucleic acid-binding protein
MTELVFVDTNVFIHAFDAAHPQKQQAARHWRSQP